ncbi:hypothetical protein ACRE_084330 [Hapsidospora chrysogenum ATCC 11550]|uniref:Uncharacterized protein n=1 Tax=Hapsidospora chrysogenum (strain ATCC 11550 / CBS 779.69 / DSM 880 / IAM 14645 / JCM 23072 / IMI 49137) TaxID=857340 RepID=A0A086SUT4_HAPC1|nr:hypothetical protein ACRE_084330 [Hapsidospora chrysogenum ATCC 11550]
MSRNPPLWTPQDGECDDLPPPYTPGPAPPSSDGLFTSHLHDLVSQAHASASSSSTDVSDSQILATLVDPVESFLASIPHYLTRRPLPRIVEATFVPADALGAGWRLTEEGDSHRGEVSRMIRVERARTKGGDDKSSWNEKSRASTTTTTTTTTTSSSSRRIEERGFTDWGRYDDEPSPSDADPDAALWFADEHLARRLARHLQPRTTTLHDPTGTVAGMSVRADEITFRGENEMGIWESKTGWAIVLRVEFCRRR